MKSYVDMLKLNISLTLLEPLMALPRTFLVFLFDCRAEKWAQCIREYGAEEDIWAKKKRGNRAVEKTYITRSFIIFTPHQMLFR